MTENQIRKLDQLGFVWALRSPRNWYEMVEKLIDYSRLHGNCNLPYYRSGANRKLALWVHRQRALKRKGELSAEQIHELDEIGFVWTARQRSNWDEMVAALVTFKKAFKHCDVPYHFPQNPPLGKWVAGLRARKKAGTLSRERIRELDAIGFSWNLVQRRNWGVMISELVRFYHENGHCNVPSRFSNKELASWVLQQRAAKKAGTLGQERIEELNKLGFQWNATKRTDWEIMFGELVRFQKNTGHANVPGVYPKDQVLANWVRIQRRLQLAGRLSSERLERLNAVGITWSSPRRKRAARRIMSTGFHAVSGEK